MKSISNIITSSPTLPNRFISSKYNHFLFFDFFLTENTDFYEELQKSVGSDSEIDLYCPQNLEPLGRLSYAEDWSEKICSIYIHAEKNDNCLGLIIADHNQDWLIIQDLPINFGVFAFNGESEIAMNLFNTIDHDWFLSIDDFKKAIVDKNSALHDYLDMSFINTLVLNYNE